MITYELNTGLIEAVKEKLPEGSNLANTLMDILYIGKEAIYRRFHSPWVKPPSFHVNWEYLSIKW